MISPNLNSPPPVSESAIGAALTLLGFVSDVDGCRSRIAELTKQEAAVRDAIAEHQNAARIAGATHKECVEKLEELEKAKLELDKRESELRSRQAKIDQSASVQEAASRKLAEREAAIEKRERAFEQKVAEFRANLGA
jgi:Skp family chaperone for outer membrane proteins